MSNERGEGKLRVRAPGILAIILISVLGIQAIAFALRKGNTYDEIIDIAAGFAYLRTGNYRLCPEHPVLATTLTAAPLLFLEMNSPRGDPEFGAETRWPYAFKMVHENRTKGGTILFLARLPSILLALVLGWLLFRFGRRELGPWGGIGALFLLATSPTFIAHTALATADSILAVAAFASFVTLRQCLGNITWRGICLAGVLLGAALAVKMTALILLPVAVILGITSIPGGKSGPFETLSVRLPRWARRPFPPFACLSLIFLTALLTLHVCYLWRFLGGGGADAPGYLHDPGTLGSRSGLGGALLAVLGSVLPGEYVYGIREMLHSSETGWPHFLLGEVRTQAPAWAYPIVGVIKIREVVLLGLLFAVLAWRRTGFRGVLLLEILSLPVLLTLLLATGSGYHGVRILLPIFPFVFLAVGGVLGKWAEKVPYGQVLVWGAVLAAVLPCWKVYPDYLAYQNAFAGPRETDHQRLVDSDLDWGQDLPALKRQMERLGIPEVHLRYFGTDDPRRYGFRFKMLTSCEPVKGFVAISATDLQGVYLKNPDCFRWLRGYEPLARAGRSILIYHIP